MNNIKTGGAAFPRMSHTNCYDTMLPEQDGMDLRDYFAAKAMQVVLKDQYENQMFIGEGYLQDGMHEDICAEVSYMMADAMLKERLKEKNHD